MDFSWALAQMKEGKKVTRLRAYSTGMFVVLMPELVLPSFNSQAPGAKVNDRTAKFIGKDTPLDSRPYFACGDQAGYWQPGWMFANGDLLADDWALAE